MPSLLRNARTSRPMATSSVLSRAPVRRVRILLPCLPATVSITSENSSADNGLRPLRMAGPSGRAPQSCLEGCQVPSFSAPLVLEFVRQASKPCD